MFKHYADQVEPFEVTSEFSYVCLQNRCENCMFKTSNSLILYRNKRKKQQSLLILIVLKDENETTEVENASYK